MAGDIRSYYYILSKIHLPQDMSRKYFNFKGTDEKFKDKIILCISDRYLNPYIDIKLLEEFKDDFIFMGLPEEYNNFVNNYFKVPYVKIKNALEAAVVFNSCIGMIGVQGGLYSIAEMMKIPRVLITPEYMKVKCKENNDDNKIIEKIIKGPVNNNPCGGWFEVARINNKLVNSARELISKIDKSDIKRLKSNCNSKIDIWLNENIFKNKENGTYIECGANDGHRDSISYFYEKNFNWTGILVEPLSEMMNKCKSCRSDKNIFIQKGLSDKNTILEMEIPNDNLDNASFNMSESHRNNLRKFGQGKSFRKEKIEVISYKNMINEANIKNIDLAIFDVEGHESHILKSVIKSNVLPKIMVVEYDWSDKNELIKIVSNKYEILKEFDHDIIFKLKELNEQY